MLEMEPSERLGCRPHAAAEIKAHPWFGSYDYRYAEPDGGFGRVDWSKLRVQGLEAPWRPALDSESQGGENTASEVDASNFDHFDEGEVEQMEPYEDDPPDPCFAGF
jgi:hypothetical protein